ncbi:MAG: terminase small subunit [Burkholderiales bacterium]
MTPKQEAFAREYLIDLNATQAYIRAGYKVTEEVARRNGHRLLTNADVAEAIAQAQEQRAEETGLSARYVIESIQRVAECAERDNKLSEALKGFELLGKHLGIFVEKRELTGKGGKDLVPEAPAGVLVVPGVLDEISWEKMMAKHQEGGA